MFHSGFVDWSYGLVYKFMELPHRKRAGGSCLEVGAGSGDYRRLAEPNFTKYVELDLREWRAQGDVPNVERVQGDAEHLSQFPAHTFDRVIATCLLVHLNNPRAALEEWWRVLKPGGFITLYVPPEAGLLVRLARNVVFWPMARRRGYDGRMVASLEHRYSYFHLDALIRDVFEGHSIARRTFPFKFFEFDLALFHSYEIKKSA